MNSYFISSELGCYVQARITLPENKTWDDIQHWYIKWDTLYVNFKNTENYISIDLHSDSNDSIDWKYPVSVSVYGIDAEGNPNYDDELDVKG